PGAHHPHEEGATQPREGGGQREAPGEGRGVLRGRAHRVLDDGEVLRGAPRAAGQRARRAGGEAAAGGEVRPRGGQRRGGHRPAGGGRGVRVPFRLTRTTRRHHDRPRVRARGRATGRGPD